MLPIYGGRSQVGFDGTDSSTRRGTSGFAVLRYRVSFLRGIAVLREKIGGIAILRFHSAVCGIVIY